MHHSPKSIAIDIFVSFLVLDGMRGTGGGRAGIGNGGPLETLPGLKPTSSLVASIEFDTSTDEVPLNDISLTGCLVMVPNWFGRLRPNEPFVVLVAEIWGLVDLGVIALHAFILFTMSVIDGRSNISLTQHRWISFHAWSVKDGSFSRAGRSPRETRLRTWMSFIPANGIVSKWI